MAARSEPTDSVRRCPVCASPVTQPTGVGRRRTYCSHACRQVAYRRRRNGVQRRRLITLVQADARDWLPTIPDASIDLVLTDPPYHFERGSTYFRTWFETLPDDTWPNIFSHLYRVLKPDRHCLVFADDRIRPHFDLAARLAGFRLHRPLVWDKQWLGLGTAAYRSTYELICFYERGHRPGTSNNVGDVLRARRPHRRYPTQKPVSVVETLIRQSSQPGEHVLDPFCGSGTTGIAARNLRRHAKLADLNATAAARRLHLADPT